MSDTSLSSISIHAKWRVPTLKTEIGLLTFMTLPH
jgi:hypothetical protein